MTHLTTPQTILPESMPERDITESEPTIQPPQDEHLPSTGASYRGNHSTERSLKLAMAAAKTAEENRGQDIVVLDLTSITPEFDYFVFATGTSRRQLHAMSEEIDHALEDDLGDKRLGIEGYSESRWILLDYGSVVVHLFDDESRDFYALENLWSEATQVPLPWAPSPEESSAENPADSPAENAESAASPSETDE